MSRTADSGRCTLHAGRAAGQEHQIGSIEVGKRADLVLHTLDGPEMRPTSDMIRNLMFASGARSIRSVVVDGRVVLDDDEFPHLDEAVLLLRIDEGAHALWARMGCPPFSERVERRSAARA